MSIRLQVVSEICKDLKVELGDGYLKVTRHQLHIFFPVDIELPEKDTLASYLISTLTDYPLAEMTPEQFIQEMGSPSSSREALLKQLWGIRRVMHDIKSLLGDDFKRVLLLATDGE